MKDSDLAGTKKALNESCSLEHDKVILNKPKN